jgi:hypothetical protein
MKRRRGKGRKWKEKEDRVIKMAKMQYREELSKEQDWSKKNDILQEGENYRFFWGGDKYNLGPRYGKDSTCIPGQI